MTSLSDTEVKRINDYLQIDAPPAQSVDLIFVFGTRLPDPTRIVADLFHRGVAPYVVLTGGPNRLTGFVEAHAHGDLLREAGVPGERIIIEDRSTNTLENVLFALPAIDERIGITTLTSLVAVTKWHHCRRALMTLRRHLPDGVRYYTTSYEGFGVTRAGWQDDPEHAHIVLGNMAKIPEYLARGDLAEIRRDGDAYV